MKNLNAVRVKSRQKKLKSFAITGILAKSTPISQYQQELVERFFRSERFQQLKKSLLAQNLTESLEILEKSGITGDLAVYLVAVAHDLDGEVES